MTAELVRTVDGFQTSTGTIDVVVEQRVIVASGSAPTRVLPSKQRTKPTPSQQQQQQQPPAAGVHISTSNPGLVRCFFTKKDAVLGLELQRLEGGGCVIVNVAPGSVCALSGLVPGMSLIKVGLHNGGKDVTKSSFSSILGWLKKRPQKTYWERAQ